MSEIERLRRVLAEGTPGPWRSRKWSSPRMVEVLASTDTPVVPWFGFDDSSRTKTEHDANAALIAAAVNALPGLLDVAEAARAVKQAEQLLTDAPTANPDRYLQASQLLVEAKRRLRTSLARLDDAR